MKSDIYANDLFQKMLQRAQAHLAMEATTELDSYATFAFSTDVPGPPQPPSGSPIEAAFEIWWLAIEKADHMTWNVWKLHLMLERQPVISLDGGKSYRLDFRVVPHPEDPNIGDAVNTGVPLPLIGIEMDGHDFHEKTKEQVTYRNQRDRDLQRVGWRIFHFSGSEFVRHPQRCVEEVYRAADSAYMDFAGAVIRSKAGE